MVLLGVSVGNIGLDGGNHCLKTRERRIRRPVDGGDDSVDGAQSADD